MRGLGRKFDTWYISVRGAETVEVVIYSRKDEYQTFHFTAVFKVGEQEYRMENTDPLALKKEVQKKVEEVAAIPWKKFIRVHLRRSDSFHSASLYFDHEIINIAKLHDGRTAYNEEGHGGYQIGEVEVGEDDDGGVVGVIPDTPENEQAVENLSRCIGEIGKRIYGLLKPEVLEDTMAKLAKTKALPEPGKERKPTP
jgi:hypothetical protein